MSLSRLPFEEGVKRLRVSCVPSTVRRRLAFFLDRHSDANWEFLAEVLDISSVETQWLKDTVVHSTHGSPTLRLFEQFLTQRDVSLEKFVQALEKIKNLACIRVLTEEYDTGVFDRALQELKNGYNSTTISHHASNCTSLHHHHSSPTMSAEYRRRLAYLPSEVNNCDQNDGSYSSGSTCNSLEVAAESLSWTSLDSRESVGFASESGVPMNTAICRAEYQLPSLNEDQRVKVSCIGNGTTAVNRIQNVALDLSQACHGKAEPKVKEERDCSYEVLQKNCDRNPCKSCLHALPEENAGQYCELQRRQDVCACHHKLCCHATPNGHKPMTRDIKVEEMVPVCRRSPVKPERKIENGRKPKTENPEPNGTGKGSETCCFCVSHSQWNDPSRENAIEAAAICMRDPLPGNALHHPSKRVTDPLLKEELELLEKEKQPMKNPDGTTPARMTGSSYAVLQQKPFRKDSRSIRVFVTYSYDSRKHMKTVMNLCDCLKNNNFSVSIDVRENHLLSQDKMGWFDKRFKVADYVLVLISPKYYEDVTEPNDDSEVQKNESTLNTLYIHRCMQAEYMMNNCLNKRFVPVLMPGATKEHVPFWLKNTTIYLWPDQYKNLFFYMMYPAQVILQFVKREQSAKTPTVIKTNH